MPFLSKIKIFLFQAQSCQCRLMNHLLQKHLNHSNQVLFCCIKQIKNFQNLVVNFRWSYKCHLKIKHNLEPVRHPFGCQPHASSCKQHFIDFISSKYFYFRKLYKRCNKFALKHKIQFQAIYCCIFSQMPVWNCYT